MKAGNYAEHMLAGEWRRRLRKIEAELRKRRRADVRDLDRYVARLMKLKPKDVGAFRRAVLKLRKKLS